jgi:hypothetical protein
LSQEKYIQDLLDRASLTDRRTAETPMKLNVHLAHTDGEPLEYPTRYCHIVTSFFFTRPDISYYIHILGQFVSTPTQIHYSHLLLSPACSFHGLALYSFSHIVMLPGLMISLIVVLFLPTVFFLVVLSLLERIRSRSQFLVRLQRLSCVL